MKWIIRLLTVCSIIGPLRLAAQWEQVGESGNAYAIALQGSLVFSGLQNDSVYVSADQGDTWSTANTGITKIVTGRDGLHLVSVNEHAHLEGGEPGLLTYR